MEVLDQAVALDPKSPFARTLRATTLQLMGRNEDALTECGVVFSLNPPENVRRDLLVTQARARFRLKRWADAATDARAALAISPEKNDVRILLGVCLMKLTHWGDARPVWDEASKRETSTEKKKDILRLLAVTDTRLHRFDDALKEVDSALLLTPADPELNSLKESILERRQATSWAVQFNLPTATLSSDLTAHDTALGSKPVVAPSVEKAETNLERGVLDDVGGLDRQVNDILELILPFQKHQAALEKIGLKPPKGILLFGPPGTGKTLIARSLSNHLNRPFFIINAPEIVSKFIGQSSENLRKVFLEAEKSAGSVIFIDEIDAIGSARGAAHDHAEYGRVATQLLTLMDGLTSGHTIVLAATNRPDALDPALRRPGRFDREIEIGVPDETSRFSILLVQTRKLSLDPDVNLKEVAHKTNGFVGADLASLVREAGMSSFRRSGLSGIEASTSIGDGIELSISRADFETALERVKPSQLRTFRVEAPSVSWDEVVGLDVAIKELIESVDWPIKHKEIYQKAGIRPPKGILLYGPPGTGKTLLAKALASNSEASFIYVKSTDIMSRWVGQSEQTLKEVFRKARESVPCVLFFDEIDGLASKRTTDSEDYSVRLLNTFLTELDGFEQKSGVTILAATNRPDTIDEALLRSGRFDRKILIPLPDSDARKRLWIHYLEGKSLARGLSPNALVEMSEGFSGADIEGACSKAATAALRRAIEVGSAESVSKLVLTRDDLVEAIRTMKPSGT